MTGTTLNSCSLSFGHSGPLGRYLLSAWLAQFPIPHCECSQLPLNSSRPSLSVALPLSSYHFSSPHLQRGRNTSNPDCWDSFLTGLPIPLAFSHTNMSSTLPSEWPFWNLHLIMSSSYWGLQRLCIMLFFFLIQSKLLNIEYWIAGPSHSSSSILFCLISTHLLLYAIFL